MKRRPGITLIEVLVAIFVMSIGLLALLTLFPLGALRMSQALQNDRAAACASAGANICDAFGIRSDPQFDALPQGTMPLGTPSFFVTPPPVPPPVPPGTPVQYASQSGGGIPIFIDPYGVVSNSGTPLANTVGASNATNPPTPGMWDASAPSASIFPAAGIAEPSGNASVAARYFTLLDDMTFLTSGQPDTTLSGGLIPRGDRYTWAYLLHRSPPNSPTNALVDLQIVVYAGRATALPGGEATFPATGNYQDTQVTLTFPAGAPPNIRRGSWIVDTSFEPTTGSVHGDTYRVVSVTPVPGSATQLNLELQTPLSKVSGISAVTVLDNVVDIFERGTGQSNQWEFRNENP